MEASVEATPEATGMTEVGLVEALDALGQVVAAYKKRIAELEQIVATQQGIIEEAKAEPPPPAQVEEP